MLFGILIILIYSGIMMNVEEDNKKELLSCTSSSKRVLIRRRIKIIRIVSFIILICSVFGINYITNRGLKYYEQLQTVNGVIIAIIVFYQRSHYSLPISTTGFENFKINEPYILYLRGFDTDEYTPIKKIKEKTNKFSEFKFVKEIKNYFKVIAVGRTREIESPNGAERIYIDSSEWKSSVQFLMDNSEFNLILLNSRPNCIWEIEQTQCYLSKNIYIAVDYQMFLEVRRTLQGRFFMPLVKDPQSSFCFIFVNGQIKVFPFELTSFGYDQIARVLMEGAYNKTRKKNAILIIKKGLIIIIIYIFFVFIWICLLTFIFPNLINRFSCLFLPTALYSLAIYLYYSVKKVKSNEWKNK